MYLRAMKNMRTVAQASLDMARATALTPSFRATFASTCHPEKHIFDATKQKRQQQQQQEQEQHQGVSCLGVS